MITAPTPGSAAERAPARRAAAASRPFSPVRDMRAAIRPATTGVENDVPLQRAMPSNCPSGFGSGGSW